MTDEITPTNDTVVYPEVWRKQPQRTPLLHLEPVEPDLEYVEPVLLTVEQTCKLLNCGRTTVFALLASGKLERVKLQRATRISVRSIRQLVGA